jgi:hypothetical protein
MSQSQAWWLLFVNVGIGLVLAQTLGAIQKKLQSIEDRLQSIEGSLSANQSMFGIPAIPSEKRA